MIVAMAYDEDLASRIRELIASEGGNTERKMFGGIGFMIDGHMAVRPFEMRGREMKGWLWVDGESVSTKRALEPSAMQSVALARAFAPKEKK
jgi:hypothetical protein